LWTVNPNPSLPHASNQSTAASLDYTMSAADDRYGSTANGTLDGEFLDSLEAWGDTLDYSQNSLSYTRTPAAFLEGDYRPILPSWFEVYDMEAFMSDDLHRRGKLLMANGTCRAYAALAPPLDVLGAETNWLPGGAYRPMTDKEFMLRRALSYDKPHQLWMNVDFDAFGPYVESYFQRCMFYGVYPSMFSPDASNDQNYWSNPTWYNRDRPLFKKYIPIIQNLSSAGWRPITFAQSDNPSVYVERYGKNYLTVMNDSSTALTCSLTMNLDSFLTDMTTPVTLTEVVSGDTVAVGLDPSQNPKVSLALQPSQTLVLKLTQ
jgi:hypothetical protein